MIHEDRLRIVLCTFLGAFLFAVIGAAFGGLAGALGWATGKASGGALGKRVAAALTRFTGKDFSPTVTGAIVGGSEGAIVLGVLGAIAGGLAGHWDKVGFLLQAALALGLLTLGAAL